MTTASAALDSHPPTTSLQAYTLDEARRIFRQHLQCELMPGANGSGRILLGTAADHPAIGQQVRRAQAQLPTRPQSYTMHCEPDPGTNGWVLTIVGADDRGTLYALRDLEHYCLEHFSTDAGRVTVEPFGRTDWPRIEHRGHWVWGCNMPDKTAWMDNMSRWKLNELIHWDNFPPQRGREYVDFAHSRGIRLHWGFGWGWGHWNVELPEDFVPGDGGAPLCPSNEFDRAFYRRVILGKVRDLYVPTGCDGIYFQSFTEFPKCSCAQCSPKTMGQLMVEFCNPILADIFEEFPHLWVSCGIHANFGEYDFLRDLDERCNIYWENCDSGTSVRSDDEDFGYLNKTLPYAHGFGPDAPADPAWTEETLGEWMDSNAERYTIDGPIEEYYAYMAQLQRWANGLLPKPSSRKHAGTVADHSVFCRRTPFMHVALAEAQWNPGAATQPLVDHIVRSLGLEGSIPGGITGRPWVPATPMPGPGGGIAPEPKPDVDQ